MMMMSPREEEKWGSLEHEISMSFLPSSCLRTYEKDAELNSE